MSDDFEGCLQDLKTFAELGGKPPREMIAEAERLANEKKAKP
jgi:hypothetical protein